MFKKRQKLKTQNQRVLMKASVQWVCKQAVGVTKIQKVRYITS